MQRGAKPPASSLLFCAKESNQLLRRHNLLCIYPSAAPVAPDGDKSCVLCNIEIGDDARDALETGFYSIIALGFNLHNVAYYFHC